MNTKFNIQLMHYPACLLYDAQDMVYEDTREQIEELHDEHPDFEVSEDDYEFDAEEFECASKSAFVKEYRAHMPKIVISLGDAELDKPKEYRCFHRGDYCYADVELSEDWLDVMLAWIEENEEWFSDRIAEEWTSRDGFWSFMGNTVEEWIQGLKDEDDRYIGSMLYYMAYVEDNDIDDDLMYSIYEDVYVGCYNCLSQEKQDELYALTHPTGWDMTNQTEIPFED